MPAVQQRMSVIAGCAGRCVADACVERLAF